MATKGDTKSKSMAAYFTKLWTTTGATYRMIATEMNKTPYRMSNGKNWDGQNVSYYAQTVLGLKGIRAYGKTTTKKATKTTTDDDLFSPKAANDETKLAIQVLNSNLAFSKKVELFKAILAGVK
jgi:hypothetical protein